MRVRKQTSDGDYTFGQGANNFFVDNAEAVGQRVVTRLLLILGEWFLDTTDGTPWNDGILGKTNQMTRDRAIKNRILGTEGVLAITEYSSSFANRAAAISATISTIYGETTVSVTI